MNLATTHITVPSILSAANSMESHVNELNQLTDSYNTAVRETLDLTEMQNLEQLFEYHNRIESENYSLYKTVVELAAEKKRIPKELPVAEKKPSILRDEIELSEEVEMK
jgi:hypothetical protein